MREAGFAHHTFVIAPFFYQNLVGAFAPQKQPDGTLGWAPPIDPTVRGIHMGDITELGNIVAGAFAHPDQAGDGPKADIRRQTISCVPILRFREQSAAQVRPARAPMQK